MKTEPLQPVGVRVTDVSLADADADALRLLLAEHGVLVLPRQEDVDDRTFRRFLQRFGPLAFTAGETPVEGFDDLNVVSNVGRDTPPVSQWHVDTSYISRPPAYTALRAVTIPEAGGETLFSDQYRAHDTLPGELLSRLAGQTITHVVTGVDPGPGEQTSAQHRVLRPHPLSGRRALYLTSPKRCAAISGMDADETARTVAQLLEHSTRADNVYRHAWSPGDVVMWDNGCVLHKADHSGVSGDRVMHRGMVAAYSAG